MAIDDTALYASVFGGTCTLAGQTVTAIFDIAAELVIDDVITTSHAALLRTADAASAAAGQSLVADGVTYTVRQVMRLPPDGAIQRLVLARA